MFKYLYKIALICLFLFTANFVVASDKAEVTPLYKKLAKKINKAIASKKSYLIDAGEMNTYSEKWRNGGKSFITDADKKVLEKNLNSFNETYKKDGVKCYLVVGRYIVDYDRSLTRKYNEDEATLSFLENKLKDKLENKTPNVAEKVDFNPERFIAFLDKSFEEAKATTEQNGNQKTILLFYIETIEVLKGGSNDKPEAKFSTGYYSFAWANKESQLETEKLGKFRAFLESTYKDDYAQGIIADPKETASRIKMIRQTTEGISKLWGSEGDDFVDDYGFERLKNAAIDELPEWAKTEKGEPIDLEDLRTMIADAVIAKNNYMDKNQFGGMLGSTKREAEIIKDAKRLTIIGLQESWIGKHFDGLRSLVIKGETLAKVEDLIPIWSSGKRAYFYYQMAMSEKGFTRVLNMIIM